MPVIAVKAHRWRRPRTTKATRSGAILSWRRLGVVHEPIAAGAVLGSFDVQGWLKTAPTSAPGTGTGTFARMTSRSTGLWVAAQKDYWSALASDYGRLYRDEWSTYEDAAVAALLRECPIYTGALVLDLGCALGLGTRLAALSEHETAIGLDVSVAMLQRGHDEVIPVCGDITRLPFARNSAALALATFGSGSFASDLTIFFEEAFRVIEPGGWLMASFLSRVALRRVVRGRVRRQEDYTTRGSVGRGSVPCRTATSTELTRLATGVGFSVRHIAGLSVLGGICETPRLWAADQQVARRAPDLGHLLHVIARKPYDESHGGHR